MKKAHIAISCGGTGGHIFPGLAIADRLVQSGCEVTILISGKQVDKRACESISGVSIVELPAVGLKRSELRRFLSSTFQSIRKCRDYFKLHKPDAVFSTGGFVGVAPILIGRLMGASIFLHESNTIPGRANKLLSRFANSVFVGFKFTTRFFPQKKVRFTGTPVRPDFLNINKELCRRSLRVDDKRPVLLIVGGSQGAHPINELFLKSMPLLKERMSNWKFIHVTGKDDYDTINSAYKEAGLDALVHSFYDKMSLLLGSATVVVCRGGASFLAELCAVGVPPLIIPFPYAADNHQFYNGLAFVKAGAGRMLEQHKATSELLVGMILQLGEEADLRRENLKALREFNSNKSAEIISDIIIQRIKEKSCNALFFEPRKSIFVGNKKNYESDNYSAKEKPMLVK